MRVFFGKINKDVNTGQLDGGYYISPKESSKYGTGDTKIDIGDYCFMIGGSTISLWKAKEWKEDRLEFDILKKDVFKNTSSFMAFRFFKIDVPLLVLTKRQSPKAFYPVKFIDGFTEANLLSDEVYIKVDNYRKTRLLTNSTTIEPDSIDVQLYFDGDELKLNNSSFFENEVLSQYRDNSGFVGKGRVQKDNTIKLLQKVNSPFDYNADKLSLGRLYDAFFVDYDVPKPTSRELRYWAGGFDGAKSYDRLHDFQANNYWQALDYDESDDRFVAKESRRLFKQIEIGDKFLIKGIGGRNDLVVHYAGTVINKDVEIYRLDFDNLNIELYSGKAPIGSGAGNWRNTLLEIKRKEDIELLFNEKQIPINKGRDIVLKNPNIILYGPPGTGKTYNTVELAYELINLNEADNHKEAQDFFKQERGSHIEFITFHQNYAYEDFVQGLKPDYDNPQLRFSKVDGVFKNICTNAIFEYLKSYKKSTPSKSVADFNMIFSSFVEWLKSKGFDNIGIKTIEDNPIIIKDIAKDKYIHASHGESDVKHTVSANRLESLYNNFHNINDIKNISKDITAVIGGCNISMYWAIFNELLKFKNRNIEELEQAEEEIASEVLDIEEKKKRIKNLGLQKISEFIENDKPIVPSYVLIIDEINRANISRVFGELITLLEKDKRLGQEHEIIVNLPGGDEFAIPPNLFIIGTMNTADKSIALVDIALRRRFEFEKKYPLYKEDGLNVHFSDELKKMNVKIRELKSADFQIGHSYFMGDDFNLKYTISNKVIPLLYEYFMNDTDSVKEVLKAGGFKYLEENKTNSGLIEFTETTKVPEDSDKEGKKD